MEVIIPNQIIVREVWSHNLDEELALINRALPAFRFASLDTEFPGTIFQPKQAYYSLQPKENYSLMKRNVDELRLIQLGLTMSDPYGNLYAWQFNFRDFDPETHPHNPDSITLLRKQGIDFSRNKKNGIDSRVFAVKFRLFLGWMPRRHLTWITFQGSYDFALMIKILTGKELPDDLGSFMILVSCFFGVDSFDLKLICTKVLGMHGGLEKVAKSLGLGRVVGKSHQAGSDSLLTMQVFKELVCRREGSKFFGFNHKLYGLTGRVS